MLEGVLIIAVVGYIAGEIAGKFGLPNLIGMLISGIIMGPYVIGILPGEILELSEEIRMFALFIILFKAGLSIDKDKIYNNGSVAIRLCFLPTIVEATVVAIFTYYIFQWDFLISWLLGWIICAPSPAVIVPSMLRLKSEGWGVKKGIPDLILVEGTVSDAAAVTMFGIFLSWTIQNSGGNVLLQFGDIPLQIILGIILGLIAGYLALILISRLNITSHIIHDIVIVLGIGLALIVGEDFLSYSAFLAVMVMGFFILEKNPVIARKFRTEVDKIWLVGQIFLFVLIGAAVDINVIFEAGGRGLLIIGAGLIFGRFSGILLSTMGSSINFFERMFMVVGDMAKATVQAAIGGIPLAMGVPNGEIILAISVLSILVTAPIGAFGTAYLAPKLLEKGKVDPTKITVESDYKLLVGYDGSKSSEKALEEAVRTAREVDGEIIILHSHQENKTSYSKNEIEEYLDNIAKDIEYTIEVIEEKANPTKEILKSAEKHEVDYIYLGKHNDGINRIFVGDVTESVIKNTTIPVILFE